MAAMAVPPQRRQADRTLRNVQAYPYNRSCEWSTDFSQNLALTCNGCNDEYCFNQYCYETTTGLVGNCYVCVFSQQSNTDQRLFCADFTFDMDETTRTTMDKFNDDVLSTNANCSKVTKYIIDSVDDHIDTTDCDCQFCGKTFRYSSLEQSLMDDYKNVAINYLSCASIYRNGNSYSISNTTISNTGVCTRLEADERKQRLARTTFVFLVFLLGGIILIRRVAVMISARRQSVNQQPPTTKTSELIPYQSMASFHKDTPVAA